MDHLTSSWFFSWLLSHSTSQQGWAIRCQEGQKCGRDLISSGVLKHRSLMKFGSRILNHNNLDIENIESKCNVHLFAYPCSLWEKAQGCLSNSCLYMISAQNLVVQPVNFMKVNSNFKELGHHLFQTTHTSPSDPVPINRPQKADRKGTVRVGVTSSIDLASKNDLQKFLTCD